MSDPVIRDFGYTPRDVSYGPTTVRLPRGFVIDNQSDEDLSFTKLRWKKDQSSRDPWVGLTCAACHTGDISYKGTMLTIDGGATQADFQSFLETLRESMVKTASEPARFEDFRKQVLGPAFDDQAAKTLHLELKRLTDFYERSATLSATPVRYGPGRLDAVGHILNKVALVVGAPAPMSNPADAPVSYPFLWNVPQHDRLQWNGMVSQERLPSVIGRGLDVGALGRNTGEVLGVFADVRPVQDPGLSGFVSSIDVVNLEGLERTLERLKSPAWPTSLLGPIDAARQARGKELFEVHCVRCHVHLDRNDLTTPIAARMSRIGPTDSAALIGTDPWMACNTYTFAGYSGVLQGQRKNDDGGTVSGVDDLVAMLGITVKQALIAKKGDVVRLTAAGFIGIRIEPVPASPPEDGFWKKIFRVFSIFETDTPSDADLLKRCYEKDDKILAYKARPLNGIWATPPYLHNGSVASLMEILKPETERLSSFFVGTTEFDPINVGYSLNPSAPGNRFRFDTKTQGGSNKGHIYGAASLTDEQRLDLVEYMKGL